MILQKTNTGKKRMRKCLQIMMMLLTVSSTMFAQKNRSYFTVLAFYTAKQDLAHISFVHEANNWFRDRAAEKQFTYDSTNDWTKLNKDTLAKYQVILFLDSRPEKPEQRNAF